jgi:hypothetical protein
VPIFQREQLPRVTGLQAEDRMACAIGTRRGAFNGTISSGSGSWSLRSDSVAIIATRVTIRTTTARSIGDVVDPERLRSTATPRCATPLSSSQRPGAATPIATGVQLALGL